MVGDYFEVRPIDVKSKVFHALNYCKHFSFGLRISPLSIAE